MLLVNGLIGLLPLVFGRKLFWLVLGGLGFVAGLSLAAPLVQGQPDWVLVVVALAGGIAGVLLALFVQRIALWLVGFLAGGYFAVALLEAAGRAGDGVPWLAFLIGGLAGVAMMAILGIVIQARLMRQERRTRIAF